MIAMRSLLSQLLSRLGIDSELTQLIADPSSEAIPQARYIVSSNPS
jgi:hypothetical protein